MVDAVGSDGSACGGLCFTQSKAGACAAAGKQRAGCGGKGETRTEEAQLVREELVYVACACGACVAKAKSCPSPEAANI
jgi:hypothetical protein